MYRKNSFLTAAAFSALLLCTHPLYAEEAAAAEDAAQESDDAESTGPWTLSGSATLASEYMTRGFSDSDSKPALQGSVALEHESGWAAEIWASNVDYNDSWEAKVEVDFYLTYTFGLGPGDMTLGGGYYWYPGARRAFDYDHYEFFASYESTLPDDVATLGAEIYYSPDFFADSGTGVYVTATADVPLPVADGLSLVGHVGHQWVEENDRFGVPDYLDYSLGFAYSFEPFTVDVRFYDTNVSEKRCDNLCDARVAGSITWEW
ncbi:MAG TPA: TorF family putative porin [Alphaproteobacteria bacterium]|nr:hypothetical protein [Rhodospirillaceae bacterium]HRJ67372.1 TorF family putative porin [Alphaproteobacteria bacterium]